MGLPIGLREYPTGDLGLVEWASSLKINHSIERRHIQDTQKTPDPKRETPRTVRMEMVP
jgi:hypothetical protein